MARLKSRFLGIGSFLRVRDYRMFPVMIQTEVTMIHPKPVDREHEFLNNNKVFRSFGRSAELSFCKRRRNPTILLVRFYQTSEGFFGGTSVKFFAGLWFSRYAALKSSLRNKIILCVCARACNCLSNKFLYTYTGNYLAKLARKIIDI